MSNIDEKLTAVLSHVASIRDERIQRKLFNAVLDLQEAWRSAAQGFVAMQAERLDWCADHVNEVAESMRIDQYAPNATMDDANE